MQVGVSYAASCCCNHSEEVLRKRITEPDIGSISEIYNKSLQYNLRFEI